MERKNPKYLCNKHFSKLQRNKSNVETPNQVRGDIIKLTVKMV